jgi:hypothetical protein
VKWFSKKYDIPLLVKTGQISGISPVEHPHGGIVLIISVSSQDKIAIYPLYFKSKENSWIKYNEPSYFLTKTHKFSQVSYLNLMGNLKMVYSLDSAVFQWLSTDYGKNWKENALILEESVEWEFKNQPIFMQMGRVLLPIVDKSSGRSFAYISDTMGKSWFPSLFIEEELVEENEYLPKSTSSPIFIATGENRIRSYFQSEGNILTAISTDLGETWKSAIKTGMRCDSDTLDGKRLLDEDGNFTPSIILAYLKLNKINMAISSDIGESWEETEIDSVHGEVYNISTLQTTDEKIHVFYSTKTEIFHLEIETK